MIGASVSSWRLLQILTFLRLYFGLILWNIYYRITLDFAIDLYNAAYGK